MGLGPKAKSKGWGSGGWAPEGVVEGMAEVTKHGWQQIIMLHVDWPVSRGRWCPEPSARASESALNPGLYMKSSRAFYRLQSPSPGGWVEEPALSLLKGLSRGRGLVEGCLTVKHLVALPGCPDRAGQLLPIIYAYPPTPQPAPSPLPALSPFFSPAFHAFPGLSPSDLPAPFWSCLISSGLAWRAGAVGTLQGEGDNSRLSVAPVSHSLHRGVQC